MGLKYRHSLVLAIALGAMPALCGAATPPEIRIEPDTLYFGAAAPPADAKRAVSSLPAPAARGEVIPQALREKAAREGRARVLVRLDAAFTPEGDLGAARDVLSQRAEIERLQNAALQSLAGLDAKLTARFKFIPFLALDVDPAALDRLAVTPGIVEVEEDAIEKPSLVSSTAVIGAGTAWASGFTGSGKVIAILDTGVDKTHPYFSSGSENKVVSEACYSSDTDLYDSVCPGGVTESTAPGSGVSCSSSIYGCDHGTHVAGIAAGNDSLGPAFGVARDASLISIQVFSEYTPWSEVVTFISDQIKGLERVYELAGTYDIAAVNMSLGGGFYFDRASCDASNVARKAAIDNLRSIDIATVVASGNGYESSYVSAPACISSAIAVGATNNTDQIAAFSNIASFLDLLAPGVGVVSSVPGGGTAGFDGTSMASPHVAGAWAALKQAHPGATVSDVLALLRHTAVSVSGRGQSDLRRINLGRAVLSGPLETGSFTIFNDGGTVLSVLSMALETHVPWIRWSPEAPFDITPGGSRQVTVTVDFSGAPAGESTNRLIVASTDPDENPYPTGVHLLIDKETCYLLNRSRTGDGSLPEPSPTRSPGCSPGRYQAGAVVQLAAQADAGWDLTSWAGTDNDSSTALTNSVTMPAGDHAVGVTYDAPCHTLTRTHTGSGVDPVADPESSPGCSAGTYHFAEVIQLTASPADGWRMGSWLGTADDGKTSKTNSLVMPDNAHAVQVTYLEGVANVLLVDADFNSPDVRSYYTAALTAAGVAFDTWDTLSSGYPEVADLASYPKIVWAPGPYRGIETTAEGNLADYLDGGGCLFLSAQEYIWVEGFTPFMQSHLGVATHNQDSQDSVATGQGLAFSGLGPYALNYSSFSNWADTLFPGPGAEAAFLGDLGNPIGVFKTGPNYRTTFLGFPIEALPSLTARRDVLTAGLEFCGTIFADVPRGYWAKKWIEAIYRLGITSGCANNPLRYCPGTAVTREQMAVFLLRAKEGGSYAPPPCNSAPFTDVPAASPFCPWIKELTARGITGGCGGGKYCPGNPVTREQMAVFLLATQSPPGFVPPLCEAAPFTDVLPSSPFCPWIQELTKRGITSGCGGGKYCPTNTATRAQMAVFLVSTFGLSLD